MSEFKTTEENMSEGDGFVTCSAPTATPIEDYYDDCPIDDHNRTVWEENKAKEENQRLLVERNEYEDRMDSLRMEIGDFLFNLYDKTEEYELPDELYVHGLIDRFQEASQKRILDLYGFCPPEPGSQSSGTGTEVSFLNWVRK